MQEVFLAYRRRRRFAAEVPVTDLDDWEGYFEGMNYYEELLHMVKPESEKDRNCSVFHQRDDRDSPRQTRGYGDTNFSNNALVCERVFCSVRALCIQYNKMIVQQNDERTA
ncbi:uncharacterized protein LOC110068826 isoform X2 [Orbicella faveolata]|uniref:uncharacterized protein LOC110068826 isoform X2 n=1 Tax=Orbicella faveolata TaxID=48498 RepID=UPI0009E4569C|nr:uncharacterized protein LOC110068826 isoform X2 [Orbicella faveolata]